MQKEYKLISKRKLINKIYFSEIGDFMAFVKVAKIKELKPGQAKEVEANGIMIALYNVEGRLYATSNTCLHESGSLGEGTLENNIITCPLHGWKYDVTTGFHIMMPHMKLKTFKVKVEKEDIMVDV